jgi:hypothetical protein
MPPIPTGRRFPPPWQVEEITESFCIRDSSGQALAYSARGTKMRSARELKRTSFHCVYAYFTASAMKR